MAELPERFRVWLDDGAEGAQREPSNPAAPTFVCAVCAQRPCVCNVAVLAEVLRAAAEVACRFGN